MKSEVLNRLLDLLLSCGRPRVLGRNAAVALAAIVLSLSPSSILKAEESGPRWQTRAIEPNTDVHSVSMREPEYLKWIDDARWPTTELRRISDHAAFQQPDNGQVPNTAPPWSNYGPLYPTVQHWNCDDSLMIVRTVPIDKTGATLPTFKYTSLHLLDGRTHAYLGPCESGGRGVPAHFRWSNSDPDELLFIDQDTSILSKWKPSTKAFSIVKDFSPAYDRISYHWSGGVGDASADGRYFALSLRKPGGQWVVCCWDRQTDSILCEIPVPMEPGTGEIGYVSMSHSGTYLLIGANSQQWSEGGRERAPGVSVYTRDGKWERTFSYRGSGVNILGHYHVAKGSNGEDRWVFLYQDAPDLTRRWIKSIRLDGTEPFPGRDECVPGLICGLEYLTPANFASKGWVIVSDYPWQTDNTAYNRFPMRNMIWALKLDGSKAVYPIAESRFSLVDWEKGDYYHWIPWATANRGMTQILFKSAMNTNWSPTRGGNSAVMHAYIARAKAQ